MISYTLGPTCSWRVHTDNIQAEDRSYSHHFIGQAPVAVCTQLPDRLLSCQSDPSCRSVLITPVPSMGVAAGALRSCLRRLGEGCTTIPEMELRQDQDAASPGTDWSASLEAGRIEVLQQPDIHSAGTRKTDATCPGQPRPSCTEYSICGSWPLGTVGSQDRTLTLIPGLPNDVTLRCFARLPYVARIGSHLKTVSRAWHQALTADLQILDSIRKMDKVPKENVFCAGVGRVSVYGQPHVVFAVFDSEHGHLAYLPPLLVEGVRDHSPKNRRLHTMCLGRGNELFFFGGAHVYHWPLLPATNAWLFSCATNTWGRYPPMSHPRKLWTVAAVKRKAVVIGQPVNEAGEQIPGCGHVEVLDLDTGTWKIGADSPRNATEDFEQGTLASFERGDKVIFLVLRAVYFDGRGETPHYPMYAYDAQADEWSDTGSHDRPTGCADSLPFINKPPPSCKLYTVAEVEGNFYAVGLSLQSTRQAFVSRFDWAAESWKRVALVPRTPSKVGDTERNGCDKLTQIKQVCGYQLTGAGHRLFVVARALGVDCQDGSNRCCSFLHVLRIKDQYSAQPTAEAEDSWETVGMYLNTGDVWLKSCGMLCV